MHEFAFGSVILLLLVVCVWRRNEDIKEMMYVCKCLRWRGISIPLESRISQISVLGGTVSEGRFG